VKYFDWDNDKNDWLMKTRGISFETCITYMEQGFLLADTKNKFPHEHQNVFIVNVEGYAYKIPYVEDGEKIFLKTLYPSRDATKEYLQ
jgi:uncharacterized DUF497 family protein